MKERLKKDKKFRRSIILVGVALLILIGASIYTLFIQPSLNTETYVYKEETVTRGNLILGIMESGSLSLGESSIMYELDLTLDEDEEESEDESSDESSEEEETVKYLEIEEVYAVSGQRSKAGDVLFTFTEESVQAVRRKLSSALTEAQITLSNAETEYNISALSAKSTYDSSVSAGNHAASNYQAALTQSQENVSSLLAEIKVLELEIVEAQEMLVDEDFLESYENAQTDYEQAKNKYEETDLHNATAYTSNLTAYQQAKSQLDSIEEEIQNYKDTIEENLAKVAEINLEIDEAKDVQVLDNQEAENEYNSAVLEGELAQEIYDYSVDSIADEVTQAQADFDEIQAKMDAFESFVGENNQIVAVENGLVTSVNYEAEDNLVSAGAMLTYVKEDEYTVSINVSEEDVSAITIGDTVDLVFTAYPEDIWQGTIISITTSATAEHASTISYPVTILVEGDTSLLYGGMTADVTFVTESVEDVLYVSKKAVFEEEGITYVYKKTKDGSREKAEVTTGFADMTSIEITSGLEEGDIVYIESIMNVDEESFGSDDAEQNEIGGTQGEFPGGGEMPEGMEGFEMPEGMDMEGFEMPEGMGEDGFGMPGGNFEMPQGAGSDMRGGRNGAN